MRCEKARRWLSDALDGALTGRRRSRLEAHLRCCPACRSYRADIDRLQRGGRILAENGRVPASFWEDFGRRVASRLDATEGRTAGPWPSPLSRLWPALAGAGLMALALALYFVALRPSAPPAPVFVSAEESLTKILSEVAETPGLESSFNQVVLDSLVEAVHEPGAEPLVSFGDNALFWESLSEQDLRLIEAELKKDRSDGGRT
jgi:hypothetical protein